MPLSYWMQEPCWFDLCNHAFDVINCGLMATLFVQLSVLNMPMSRSASSNILFRKLMIINCAFFVLSWKKSKRKCVNLQSRKKGISQSKAILNGKMTTCRLYSVDVMLFVNCVSDFHTTRWITFWTDKSFCVSKRDGEDFEYTRFTQFVC